MCYNYEIDDKQLGMEFPHLTGTIYDSTEWDNNPFYSAFTFRKAPVIINEDKKSIQHFKGARIPKWTKSIEDSKKIRTQTLNARSETVFEKPSFRSSITAKRCLIPAIGFYDQKSLQVSHPVRYNKQMIIPNSPE